MIHADSLRDQFLHQLYPPPRDFTGREDELAELDQAVIHSGVATLGVWGMDGIGKTVLARELARRLKPRYPDAQLYLDLQGTSAKPLSAVQAMAHVVRAFHPGITLPPNDDELVAWYHSVLHGQRALLLLDDAVDAAQVAPLIPLERCLVLVTSWRHFTLPGLYALTLKKMLPDDARDLLLKIAPRIDGHADAMAKRCDCLPVALRLAASAVATQPDLSPEGYLERLQDQQTRLELIDASLSLSYDLLSDDLKRLWSMLAVFPGPFDRLAAAAVCALDEESAHSALGQLLCYSLVEWDDETEHYYVYSLARVYAESKLEQQQWISAQERHSEHYVCVLAGAGELYLQGGQDLLDGLAIIRLEWPNIEAGQAWSAHHAHDNRLAAKLCGAYPNVASLCLATLQPLLARIQWLEQGVAAARRIGDLRREAGNLSILGHAYAIQGQPDRTLACAQTALGIAEQLGDSSIKMYALGVLSLAYGRLGQLDKAIAHIQQAQAIAKTAGDRRGQAGLLVRLGSLYTRMSRVDDAQAAYRRGLLLGQEIRDQALEAAALGGLGYNSIAIGHIESDEAGPGAIELLKQALAVARDLGGRKLEVDIRGSLGEAHEALGETGVAVQYLEEALAPDSGLGYWTNKVIWMINLADAYVTMGQVERGLDVSQAALREAQNAGDLPGKSLVLSRLGRIHMAAQQTFEAITCLEQAVDTCRGMRDLRGLVTDLNNLGIAYQSKGLSDQAVQCHQEALCTARKVGHRQAEANALGGLGLAYADLGQLTAADEHLGAIQYLEQAVPISHEIGDSRNEGTWLGSLGNAYSGLGETDRVIGSYKSVLDIARQIRAASGSKAQQTEARLMEGGARNNLGSVYARLAEGAKGVEFAIEQYEQALSIAREICIASVDEARRIEVHIIEGTALCGLGEGYASLGEAEQAIEFYKGALTTAEKISAVPQGDAKWIEGRTMEGTVRGQLGNVYYSVANDAEGVERAIEQYEQALSIAREICAASRSEPKRNKARLLEGTSLASLGNAYHSIAQDTEGLNRAIGYMQEALQIFEYLGSPYVDQAHRILEEMQGQDDKKSPDEISQ